MSNEIDEIKMTLSEPPALDEHNDIQNIHIRYINYRFIVDRKIKHIVNFNDYIVRFYNLNKDYYIKLAEKYNIDLKK